jgi:hypothetical protein
MSSANTKIHFEQGGDKLVVESGAELELKAGSTLTVTGAITGEVADGETFAVKSGGAIDVESGGLLKFAGTDKAAELAAAVAAPVAGVAASYKIARGTITPDAATKTIVTGLTTVVAAVASLKGDPTAAMNLVSVTVGDQDGAPAAGSIILKSWMPTAEANTVPTAATANWVAVDWIAIGT